MEVTFSIDEDGNEIFKASIVTKDYSKYTLHDKLRLCRIGNTTHIGGGVTVLTSKSQPNRIRTGRGIASISKIRSDCSRYYYGEDRIDYSGDLLRREAERWELEEFIQCFPSKKYKRDPVIFTKSPAFAEFINNAIKSGKRVLIGQIDRFKFRDLNIANRKSIAIDFYEDLPHKYRILKKTISSGYMCYDEKMEKDFDNVSIDDPLVENASVFLVNPPPHEKKLLEKGSFRYTIDRKNLEESMSDHVTSLLSSVKGLDDQALELEHNWKLKLPILTSS